MIDSQLLCTFTTKSNLENTVNTIKQSYTIVFDKIYVLQNEDRNKELICTYNVNNDVFIIQRNTNLYFKTRALLV